MSVRVVVTAADIASGTRRATTCCPVALAIRRAVGPCVIQVNRQRIAVDYRAGVPPAAVAAFVEAFDNGRRVEPFAFDLERGR